MNLNYLNFRSLAFDISHLIFHRESGFHLQLLEFERYYLEEVAVVVDNSKIWAVGGTGYTGLTVLQNTEYIYADGSVESGPMLPYCIDEHCTLQLNATYTMIILGENYDTGVYGSTETFFFNHS